MKLYTQIWNERKHNFWIWLELFVVSIVLWYVIDLLYVFYLGYAQPLGYNIDNVYHLEIQTLDSSNPDFKTPENGGMTDGQAILELMSRLRQNSDIEYVCLSKGAEPYFGGNSCDWLFYGDRDSSGHVFDRREVTSDFMHVFQIEGINGESSEDLVNILNEKKTITSLLYIPDSLKTDSPINKKLKNEYIELTIGAEVLALRKSEFGTIWADAFYIQITEENILKEYITSGWWRLAFRVKDGTSSDFADRLFAEANLNYQVGNLIINSIEPFSRLRDVYILDSLNTLRNNVAICLFLLLNIFFGIFGTFWFRTQQRRHEIALLRAIGSSQAQTFSRIIREGFVLLLAGSLVAWIVDFFLARYGITAAFYGESLTTNRFIITILLTFACMMLMIFIGTLIPARKTQQINISTALHED